MSGVLVATWNDGVFVGGLTWHVSSDGLHAPHCFAVAFVGADVFVSASRDPFDPTGRVYRRPIGQSAPLRWGAQLVDTIAGARLTEQRSPVVRARP